MKNKTDMVPSLCSFRYHEGKNRGSRRNSRRSKDTVEGKKFCWLEYNQLYDSFGPLVKQIFVGLYKVKEG